ncbi:MAG: lamin tail domain-containing protein, partial [Verrucomicrobiales bacterium]
MQFFLKWPRWMLLASYVALGALNSTALFAQSPPPHTVLEPDVTTASDSIIAFNEIMYHPSAEDAGGEWIEIYNQMSVPMDLSGWKLAGGVDFLFPTNTTLLANSYLVIAADPASVLQRSPGISVLGPFTRRLSSSGETLQLRNHNNRIMAEMTFTDSAPWPMAADGSGASLAKLNKFAAGSPAVNWRASTHWGGTPGKENFVEALSQPPKEDLLIWKNSPARFLTPQDGSQGVSWIANDFEDASWMSGSAAAGFYAKPSTTTPVAIAARAYSFTGNVLDVSNHGFSGDNFGVQYTSSVPPAIGSGQSASFDGSSAHIKVFDPVHPEAYTLSAWVFVNEVRASSIIVRT